MATKCFYVYALIDPNNGEIFYIGKGKGNRWKQHGKEGLKNSRKWRRINQIKASGKEYQVEFLATGLTNSKALMIERQHIQRIGCKQLTNISRGETDILARTMIESLAMLKHLAKQPKGFWRDKLMGDFINILAMAHKQAYGNAGTQEHPP